MEELIWLTGGVILVSMIVAYSRNRDPLHPLMFIGPMILYVHAVVPGIMFYRGQCEDFFPSMEIVEMAQSYVLLAVACFCMGSLNARASRRAMRQMRKPIALTPAMRTRVRTTSYVLAVIGIGAFLYMAQMRGGLIATYSTPKGRGWAPSGYITSAPLLTIPAIMLLFLSQAGERMNWKTIAIAMVFASPQLIHGLLGGRRGAAFLAIATTGFGWYLATGKRPSWRTIVAGVAGAGLLMMFLASQRSHIYIGSDFEFDQEAFREAVVPAEIEKGSLAVYSWGRIVMKMYHGNFGWGRSYLTHAVIRPIPRQIWPTKYEDARALLYGDKDADAGGEAMWRDALGWAPPAGSASGFVADTFAEFSWGGLGVCYLLGLFYGYLWMKAGISHGVWRLLYLEASVLSVFMITQGLASSWLYRMIYIGVPTYLLWYGATGFRSRHAVVAPAPRQRGPGRGVNER